MKKEENIPKPLTSVVLKKERSKVIDQMLKISLFYSFLIFLLLNALLFFRKGEIYYSTFMFYISNMFVIGNHIVISNSILSVNIFQLKKSYLGSVYIMAMLCTSILIQIRSLFFLAIKVVLVILVCVFNYRIRVFTKKLALYESREYFRKFGISVSQRKEYITTMEFISIIKISYVNSVIRILVYFREDTDFYKIIMCSTYFLGLTVIYFNLEYKRIEIFLTIFPLCLVNILFNLGRLTYDIFYGKAALFQLSFPFSISIIVLDFFILKYLYKASKYMKK